MGICLLLDSILKSMPCVYSGPINELRETKLGTNSAHRNEKLLLIY